MQSLNILVHEPRVTTCTSIDYNSRIPGSNETGGLIDLMAYAKQTSTLGPIELIVEIGSYRGVSTEVFLNFCSRVIAVDIWPEELARAKREFDARFSTEPGMSYLRMSSTEAAKLFRDEVIDLIYIDADHSYDSVLADITDWLPKVKYSGFISGHDYDARIEGGGVCRAVNKKFGKPDNTFRDTSWIVMRR